MAGCSAGPAASTAPAASDQPATPSPTASSQPTASQRPTVSLQPAASPAASQESFETFSSDRFPYSIGVPAAWTGRPGDDGVSDWFEAKDGDGAVNVVIYPDLPEDRIAGWFDEIRAAFKNIAVDAQGVRTVGGFEALYHEWHQTWNGRPSFLMQVSLVGGSHGWDVTWASKTGAESVDRLAFDRILDAFKPGTGAVVAVRGADNVYGLSVGGCFLSSHPFAEGRPTAKSLFVGLVGGFEAVSCAAAHDGEVIAVIADKADPSCDSRFLKYVGRPVGSAGLAVIEFFSISKAEAPAGVAGLCVAFDPAGPVTGSARKTQP
jgi:hypothetical protein